MVKKVKKVVKQLAKASRLHKAQSNVLKKHIKSMTNGRPKKRNR
jgi:hydroxymethylglutaryl-CoA reductase